MKQHFWNYVAAFYRKLNRMRSGENINITNWQVLGERENYNHPHLNYNSSFDKLIAHCYWCGDVGEKQLFSIKSFVYTQNMENFEVWLWLDEKSYIKALKNMELSKLSQRGGIKIKKWSIEQEIQGTPYSKVSWYFKGDRPLPCVGDDFRVVALYKYGGMYFDLDVMFCRDMTALFMREEFIYAWEQQPFANSAILFIRKGSHIAEQIARTVVRKKSSQPWSVFNYNNRNLKNLMVYPCYMFDPLWNGYIEGMPIKEFAEFFRPFDSDFQKSLDINSIKDFFPGIYAYHWHNCWKAEEYEDSYFGLFRKEVNQALES